MMTSSAVAIAGGRKVERDFFQIGDCGGGDAVDDVL